MNKALLFSVAIFCAVLIACKDNGSGITNNYYTTTSDNTTSTTSDNTTSTTSVVFIYPYSVGPTVPISKVSRWKKLPLPWKRLTVLCRITWRMQKTRMKSHRKHSNLWLTAELNYWMPSTILSKQTRRCCRIFRKQIPA